MIQLDLAQVSNAAYVKLVTTLLMKDALLLVEPTFENYPMVNIENSHFLTNPWPNLNIDEQDDRRALIENAYFSENRGSTYASIHIAVTLIDFDRHDFY